MKSQHLLASLALALTACASTQRDIGSADKPMQKHDASAQGSMPLPPGWTEADMQACMLAGTPGEMHTKLMRHTGNWTGKCTMWMAPETQPMENACTAKISSVLDGHYAKWEFNGEMPGMGPYLGYGFMGFDNTSQKFVSSWLDNHNTGIMQGEGEMAKDGNSLTWTYKYNCPIRKGPATMREVYTFKGDDSITIEMTGADPKSGKEYMMMRIDLTRTSS